MVNVARVNRLDNLLLPEATRATQLNAHMHRDLRASLAHIAERLREHHHASLAALLEEFIARVGDVDDFSPLIFGLYYRISFALLHHNIDLAEELIKILVAQDITPKPHITLRPFENETLYSECLGEHEGFCMAAPHSDEFVAFKQMFSTVMEQIIAKDTALYQEMHILLRHVVVAEDASDNRSFNGMAPYQLWRLLFLNVHNASSPLQMLETLLHETAHIYLFGHTIDAPLVLNAPEERYFSPIRGTQRPMDGIYHAMFVTARVAYLLGRLECHIPEAMQHDFSDIFERITQNKHTYLESVKIVEEHARLSKPAQRLLEDVKEIMK